MSRAFLLRTGNLIARRLISLGALLLQRAVRRASQANHRDYDETDFDSSH